MELILPSLTILLPVFSASHTPSEDPPVTLNSFSMYPTGLPTWSQSLHSVSRCQGPLTLPQWSLLYMFPPLYSPGADIFPSCGVLPNSYSCYPCLQSLFPPICCIHHRWNSSQSIVSLKKKKSVQEYLLFHHWQLGPTLKSINLPLSFSYTFSQTGLPLHGNLQLVVLSPDVPAGVFCFVGN